MPVVLSPTEIDFLRQTREYMQLPDNYCVADLETCGFSPERDLIIEVGIGHVVNRQLVSRQCAVLDWTRYEGIDQDYLASQLERIRVEYEKKGRSWRYNMDVLKAEGHDPIQVLHTYVMEMYKAITGDEMIVGHGFHFDRRMIDAHARRFLNGYQLPWHDEAIFDSGLIVKGSQIGKLPWPGESREAWFNRIRAAQVKGVMWALDGYCVERYELVQRYGIDVQQAHSAGYDVMLCHLMVETFRHLLEHA